MRKVTPNIYVNSWTQEQVRVRGCNSSFVVTSNGVVVVDTPYLPTDAVRWREEISKRGEVHFVVNTEHHPDHTIGNYFFSGTVVSSQIMRALFADMLKPSNVIKMVKEKDPDGLPLVANYQPRPPTITFSDKLDIYSGDHTFELICLPGHTQGQIAVFVPQERVVFTGDNFVNGWQPSLNYCCPLEWIESLKIIEAMDVDIVIPGHGDVGDRKTVHNFREFVQECIDVVKGAIKQGMSNDEAAEKISFETGDYPPPIHPGAQWQRRNIIRLYEMLSK